MHAKARRQCIREFIVTMSLIWAWYFFPMYIFFVLFMVKSHIFAMLWLLFIRCRQLENVIGFLSQIIIYIFRGCQILFWNKLNQNDITVRSLYINLFFLIKINFLWLKKNLQRPCGIKTYTENGALLAHCVIMIR